MKKILPVVFFVLVIVPFCAAAHTSDQRYVDGYIVDLSTAPVAPWVGEKVGLSFVFRDPATGLATTSVGTASISIDALMRANKKPPEVIYESGVFPVANSGFVSDYVFLEEGTYDMHLSFIDTSGITHVTGFRKQVRASDASSGAAWFSLLLVTVLITSILSFVAGRLYKATPK